MPTRIAITNMDGHQQTENLVLLVEILAVPSLTDHTCPSTGPSNSTCRLIPK